MRQSHPDRSVSVRSERTPAGLIVPIHATVRGRVLWQTLDERGVPEIPRTPSGIPVGPVEGVEQPNLITNVGLDALAVDNWVANTNNPGGWRRNLYIGTGSSAPDVTDTELDNEVQSIRSSPGPFFNHQADYALDTDNDDVWRERSRRNQVIEMTADRNLTEFGWGDGQTNVRELLRDGGGTPITISLVTGKSLRVEHTLISEIAAPAAGINGTVDVEEYDAANDLLDTTPYDITYGASTFNTVTDSRIEGIFGAWRPALTANNALALLKSATSYSRTANPSASATANASLVSYTSGDYYRDKVGTITAGADSGVVYGYRYRYSPSVVNGGFMFCFTDPASYTWSDTDEAVLGVRSTWARA